MRRLIALAAGLFVVAACTGASTETSQQTTSVSTTPQVTDVEGLPGRLVTLDASGNIVVIEPDGTEPVAITSDAGPIAQYAQPSWSPDSDRLAWSELTSTGLGVGISDSDGSNRIRVDMGAPPFFLYWSPDGEAIGVLHNGQQSIEFELVDVAAGSTSVAANGSPFYFSWSPDGSQVVAHIARELFGTIDREGGTEDLGGTEPGYQSPHWTPSGIFHRGAGGLELRAPGGPGRVLATLDGPLAMVANPQGTRVAAQSYVEAGPGGINAALSETPVVPANRVVVIDVASGEMEVVTEDISVGFFWSPDGDSLLILEPRFQQPVVDVTVWSDGEKRQLMELAPPGSLVTDVLRFFDQYSQSLQIWSPDSSAVVLPGAVGDESGIWVQMMAGGEPVEVADGSWAVWSGA